MCTACVTAGFKLMIALLLLLLIGIPTMRSSRVNSCGRRGALWLLLFHCCCTTTTALPVCNTIRMLLIVGMPSLPRVRQLVVNSSTTEDGPANKKHLRMYSEQALNLMIFFFFQFLRRMGKNKAQACMTRSLSSLERMPLYRI